MPLFGIVKGNWLNKRETEATCSEIFDSHLVLVYISWEMTEVKRGSHVSFNWFYAGPLFWRKWDWQTFLFKEGGKPEILQKKKKPRNKATGPEPNADHIGWKRALSPLDDSCSQMCTKIRQKWHLFSYCKDGHLWS